MSAVWAGRPSPTRNTLPILRRRSFVCSTKDRNHYITPRLTYLTVKDPERKILDPDWRSASERHLVLSFITKNTFPLYLEVQEELSKGQSIRHLGGGTVTI